MELLTKLRNLLLMCLAIGIVLAVAPVQLVSAGEYVMHEEEGGYAMDPPGEYTSNSSATGNASYDTGSLSSECHASAWVSAHLSESGIASASMYTNSFAYAERIWEWTGEGTPTGGTLEYNFTVSGGNSAWGEHQGSGQYTTADTATMASSSSNGESGVSSCCGGGVNCKNEGSTFTFGSPSEYISTDGDKDYGWYWVETSWYLQVTDEEEISEGTTTVSFSVASTCTAASARTSVGSGGQYVEGEGSGACNASAYGSASFE